MEAEEEVETDVEECCEDAEVVVCEAEADEELPGGGDDDVRPLPVAAALPPATAVGAASFLSFVPLPNFLDSFLNIVPPLTRQTNRQSVRNR